MVVELDGTSVSFHLMTILYDAVVIMIELKEKTTIIRYTMKPFLFHTSNRLIICFNRIGTVSFVLLCMQYARSQIQNLGIKPYTEAYKNWRARRLCEVSSNNRINETYIRTLTVFKLLPCAWIWYKSYALHLILVNRLVLSMIFQSTWLD
jgi:hypothetical protein